MNSFKKLIQKNIGFYSIAARKHSKWVDICLPSPRRDRISVVHPTLSCTLDMDCTLGSLQCGTMWYNVVQCVVHPTLSSTLDMDCTQGSLQWRLLLEHFILLHSVQFVLIMYTKHFMLYPQVAVFTV